VIRLLFLFVIISADVVELECVAVLGGGNDTDPVPESVLLQELFGEVLEVSLGQRDARGHGKLVVGGIPSNLHIFTKLTCFAFDLDTVVQEFFKVGAVEDLVSSRLRVVDNEFVLGSNFSGGGFGHCEVLKS